jgi:hypothetical protein
MDVFNQQKNAKTCFKNDAQLIFLLIELFTFKSVDNDIALIQSFRMIKLIAK